VGVLQIRIHEVIENEGEEDIVVEIARGTIDNLGNCKFRELPSAGGRLFLSSVPLRKPMARYSPWHLLFEGLDRSKVGRWVKRKK